MFRSSVEGSEASALSARRCRRANALRRGAPPRGAEQRTQSWGLRACKGFSPIADGCCGVVHHRLKVSRGFRLFARVLCFIIRVGGELAPVIPTPTTLRQVRCDLRQMKKNVWRRKNALPICSSSQSPVIPTGVRPDIRRGARRHPGQRRSNWPPLRATAAPLSQPADPAQVRGLRTMATTGMVIVWRDPRRLRRRARHRARGATRHRTTAPKCSFD